MGKDVRNRPHVRTNLITKYVGTMGGSYKPRLPPAVACLSCRLPSAEEIIEHPRQHEVEPWILGIGAVSLAVASGGVVGDLSLPGIALPGVVLMEAGVVPIVGQGVGKLPEDSARQGS